MDAKYRRALEELLAMPTITDWERNAFTDILGRAEKWGSYNLSMKQKALIDKCVGKYITGDGGKGHEGPMIPESYPGLRMSRGDDGYKIVINEMEIGRAITKKEGVLILAWLNGQQEEVKAALDMVQPVQQPQSGGETSEEEAPYDEPLPF